MQWKMDMRFSAWTVWSLYSSGSLTTSARELQITGRYKLHLIGVKEVRWDKGGTVRAGDYIFFLWKRKRKSSIGNRVFFLYIKE